LFGQKVSTERCKLLTLAAEPREGIRKGNSELKSWVDEWVTTNLKNGKLNAIYKKYFDQSLPE